MFSFDVGRVAAAAKRMQLKYVNFIWTIVARPSVCSESDTKKKPRSTLCINETKIRCEFGRILLLYITFIGWPPSHRVSALVRNWICHWCRRRPRHWTAKSFPKLIHASAWPWAMTLWACYQRRVSYRLQFRAISHIHMAPNGCWKNSENSIRSIATVMDSQLSFDCPSNAHQKGADTFEPPSRKWLQNEERVPISVA